MFTTALFCLAANIFHEARGEHPIGQYAVAQVTMNRAGDDPDKVCGVVYAKAQFSWTLSAKKRLTHPKKINPEAWKTAKIIAAQFMQGKVRVDITRGADHYYADYISKPKWAKKMKRTTKFGRHIFYASL